MGFSLAQAGGRCACSQSGRRLTAPSPRAMLGGMFDTAAETYDRHIGRYSSALARELIAAAGVQGGPALDVGCGPGGLTAELLKVADRVCAIDPSRPFAEACAERHPQADVRVGSAESLPFADGAFAFTLAQLVVNFL